MSIRVIVSLEVKDYEDFSNLFNSEGPVTARKEAGIVAEAHKNLDSPTNAVVIGTATSKEDFLTFFSSAAQAERMQNAGVVSKPTVTFLGN
tara:strand:+ start:852 stop:1124 length:273 start_codon:yes stop_codon:yes gene_type:complete